MNTLLLLLSFAAFAFAGKPLAYITADSTHTGTLKKTVIEYGNGDPANYAVWVPINTKDIVLTYTATGSCEYFNTIVQLSSPSCVDQVTHRASYECSIGEADYPELPSTSQFNYPTDFGKLTWPLGKWIFPALYASTQDCPYKFQVTYDLCASNQVGLLSGSSLACWGKNYSYKAVAYNLDYVNGTIGEEIHFTSSASKVFYRFDMPQNVGTASINLISSTNSLWMVGSEGNPRNLQTGTMTTPVFQYDSSDGITGSAFSYNPQEGSFWVSFVYSGNPYDVTFSVTINQCADNAAGYNCSYPLTDLRDVMTNGAVSGTAKPANAEGFHPADYFYLDFVAGKEENFVINLDTDHDSTFLTVRKDGAPWAQTCTHCYEWDNNKYVDDKGNFYVTGNDTVVGGRLYFGVVNTESESSVPWTISMKKVAAGSGGSGSSTSDGSNTTGDTNFASVIIPSLVFVAASILSIFL